jgi:serine/threonine protein kinase
VALKIEHALPPGYMLHHYRIQRTLGGGGFSIVYLAHDTREDRQVVVKEYLPSSQATRVDEETVESISAEASVNFRRGMKRFLDEAAALARIDHPNIVHVIDFFRENNTVYIVMQYEEGKDLRWYIKRHDGRLSEKFIRTVFSQLLDGLKVLHGHGLLHLDIKPANIYLRPGGRPLLLDFGAAQKAFSGNKRAGAHTLTMGFAPLEQHHRGHIGPWTDLYAVGASIYACMSGRAPPPSLKRDEYDTYRPALRQFARHYTRELLEVVDWCLQLHQLERPQKVDDILPILSKPASETVAADETSFIDKLRVMLPWGSKD